MKYTISWIAFLAVIIFIIPLLLNAFFPGEKPRVNDFSDSGRVRVFIAGENRTESMPLDEYLVGVVSAEMPASFEYQALKAQAVAARTYALSKINSAVGAQSHSGADVCTDSAHCQAYICEADAKRNWGKNASKYYEKCKNAVLETSGEIMIYDSEPIKAVFHSSSSGRTENSEDVWGGEIPYLRSVQSPGEEACPSHKSEVVKSLDEFKRIILSKYKVDFSKEIIGKCIRTEGGAVESLSIGGAAIKGTELRSVFSLKSACFDVSVDGDKVIFTVIGNGHGVGMSQYGANYLALHGYDYKQILKKYYTGISFENINE